MVAVRSEALSVAPLPTSQAPILSLHELDCILSSRGIIIETLVRHRGEKHVFQYMTLNIYL